MAIDNISVLWYIDGVEVNRCVPSGQLEPISMKQPVGFFFAVTKQISPKHLLRKEVSAVFFSIQTCHSCYNIKALAPPQVERHNNRISVGIRCRGNNNCCIGDSVRFQQKHRLVQHFRKLQQNIIGKVMPMGINLCFSLRLCYNRLRHNNGLIPYSGSLQILRCIAKGKQLRRFHFASFVVGKLFRKWAVVFLHRFPHQRIRYLPRFLRLRSTLNTVNQSPLRFGQPVIGFLCRGLSF